MFKQTDLFQYLWRLASKYRYVILLCLLGILPYLYYPQLNSPNAAVSYYSNKIYFNVWSNMFFGNFVFFLLPINYLIYLVSHIFSSAITTNIAYGILLATGGVSTYFVGKKLIKEELISFIIGLFYMYGIYGQFASFWDGINILLPILPLITLCMITISKKTNVLLYSIIIGFLLFFLTGVNLTFIAYLLMWMGLLMVYKIYELGWRESPRIIGTVVLGVVLSVMLSFYCYATIFAQFHYQSSIINTSLVLESPIWKSSSSWLSELIREMGSVSYYYYFKGYAYPNALIFIYNPFFIFVSFIFPFLAFMSSTLYRKHFQESKILLFISPFLIFLLFMAMGVFYLSPTKDVYWWFYSHIPYFSIFRDAYKPMFVIHFLYAILIGFTLKYFYTYKHKIFVWIAGLTLISIAVISFQFWSGTFLKYEIINIPQYWDQFSHFVSDKRQAITLALPNMPFTGYEFTTNKGKNTSFFRSIFDNNVIYEQGGTVYDDSLIRTLYKSAVTRPQCFQNLAGLTGVHYILNQYDLYVQLYDSWITPQRENASLEKMSEIQFEKKFGKLKLYSLNPQLIYDKVYIPKKTIYSKTQNYCDIALQSNGKNDIAVISDKTIQTRGTPSHVSMSFDQYNNAVYLVDMSKMKTDQLLVLNTRYDGGWKVYEVASNTRITFPIILSLITRSPLNVKHIGINGFANGWDIQHRGDTRKFILIYMPQLYFYWGLIISGVTCIILFFLLIFLYIKKK